MKREILCLNCKYGESYFRDDEDYFFHKITKGLSKSKFNCDRCYDSIEIGDVCYAVSIWRKSEPGFEWESDYIVTDPVLLKMRNVT
jgi:hypothetical protein